MRNCVWRAPAAGVERAVAADGAGRGDAAHLGPGEQPQLREQPAQQPGTGAPSYEYVHVRARVRACVRVRRTVCARVLVRVGQSFIAPVEHSQTTHTRTCNVHT